MPTVTFQGVAVACTTLDGAVNMLLSKTKEPLGAVRLANAYTFALAARNSDYLTVLRGPGVTLPDGAPLSATLRVLARRRQIGCRPCRVRGPSLFAAALQQGVSRKTRHFLAGSTPETLALLEQAIHRVAPGVQIAGSFSPPFEPPTQATVVTLAAKVKTSEADIVWLGLGTPRQDVLAALLAEHVDIPVVGVGAAFDFQAGTIREAPLALQRLGFEWAFRLAQEPRRLLSRYTVGNATFLRLIARELSGKPAGLSDGGDGT